VVSIHASKKSTLPTASTHLCAHYIFKHGAKCRVEICVAIRTVGRVAAVGEVERSAGFCSGRFGKAGGGGGVGGEMVSDGGVIGRPSRLRRRCEGEV
jgi:hypothetical protein